LLTRVSASIVKEPEKFPPPKTINERSLQRFYQTNPVEKRREEVGLPSLTSSELQTWANAKFIKPIAKKDVLVSNKVEREFWKQVSRESLPYRKLKQGHDWGRDRSGCDVGEYTLEQFGERSNKETRLRVLEVWSQRFRADRELASRGFVSDEGKTFEITEEKIVEEQARRKEMAGLRSDLYGERTGSYAQDPEWDDVEPIQQIEPEGALAAIAYSDEYVEGITLSLLHLITWTCSADRLSQLRHTYGPPCSQRNVPRAA
jgi:protein farnesyltransferase/geranylgeranyltransferase type-1 subunit alpha